MPTCFIGGHGKPPFGILQVDSREPRQFTDGDTGFLRSYANLSAAAVNRLQSHEALEAKVAERTRELNEANANLQGEAEERERVEDALRQSHKMETVGQLTGGLAHDQCRLLVRRSASPPARRCVRLALTGHGTVRVAGRERGDPGTAFKRTATSPYAPC